MTAQHLARRSRSSMSPRFETSRRHTVAGYAHELGKQQNRLREALGREEELRHQNDELIEQQRVLSALLASREGAAESVARLTPRQRHDPYKSERMETPREASQMKSQNPLIVRIAAQPISSIGDRMGDIRIWLDHNKIDLSDFRLVKLNVGNVAFDAKFSDLGHATLFRAAFGSAAKAPRTHLLTDQYVGAKPAPIIDDQYSLDPICSRIPGSLPASPARSLPFGSASANALSRTIAPRS